MNASAELLKELRLDRSSPPPAGGKTGWIVAAIVLVLVVLAVVAWFWRGHQAVPEVRSAQAVALAGPAAGTAVLDASGYVVARRMATVSAKITGRVLEVAIEEGMRVEADQVMARLDPVDADAQLELAQAQVAAARSQIVTIEAQLAQAEADAKRQSALVERGLASQAQLEVAVAQRDSLRAQRVTARHNAQVAEDQLQIARNGVDNTIVRAPFAGVVIAKAAQPGEIVSPMATGGYTRTGIGTIVDMDSLEVEVDVGEAYIGRVQARMPAEVMLNAYPDWRIPAEVIAIIPTADRGKATVKVRVGLQQKDARIVPDMGVRVSFLEAARSQEDASPKGVRIPQSALVEAASGPGVFVIRDGQVSRRAIQPGTALGTDRQVLSGLSAGERVVLDPPASLQDGDRVQVVTSP